MAAWFLVALQVAGPPAPAPPRRPSDRPCPVPQPGEDIVVCARPNDSFRLKPVPERYSAERAPPKAEASIPGFGAIVAEAERGADAQGAPINRAMIRLRVPLGGEKR